MFSGENVDLHERLVVPHKVERLLGGKDKVQTFGELLEEAHELKAQVFIIEQIKESVVIGEVSEAMRFEEVHDGGMARLELSQFLLGKTKHIQNFVLFPLVVIIESFLQVVANTDVINDKTLSFAAPLTRFTRAIA